MIDSEGVQSPPCVKLIKAAHNITPEIDEGYF